MAGRLGAAAGRLHCTAASSLVHLLFVAAPQSPSTAAPPRRSCPGRRTPRAGGTPTRPTRRAPTPPLTDPFTSSCEPPLCLIFFSSASEGCAPCRRWTTRLHVHACRQAALRLPTTSHRPILLAWCRRQTSARPARRRPAAHCPSLPPAPALAATWRSAGCGPSPRTTPRPGRPPSPSTMCGPGARRSRIETLPNRLIAPSSGCRQPPLFPSRAPRKPVCPPTHLRT